MDVEKNSKQLKVRVSIQEDKIIEEEARKRHLSKQEYIRMKLLDNLEGVDNKCRQIARLMPEFYNKVHEIPNQRLKEWFYDWGGVICQSLK